MLRRASAFTPPRRWRQTVLTDPVPRLRGIQAPTLLIWGKEDALSGLLQATQSTVATPPAGTVDR